jgi:uncharacterized protein YjiS (DUF1127 family)
MTHHTITADCDPGIGARRAPGRPLWRRVLGWLLAVDTLARERYDLASLNAHTLRDIGIGAADVTDTLRRPDRHLRSIRARDQFEH